jgi:hypothetical protein
MDRDFVIYTDDGVIRKFGRQSDATFPTLMAIVQDRHGSANILLDVQATSDSYVDTAGAEPVLVKPPA